MSQPIVFISHSRVLDGQLDGLHRFLDRGSPALSDEKPRTQAFLPYLSADRGELTIVHVFADAEAFDAHLEGVAERSSAAGAFIRTIGFEIYGQASARALALLQGGAAAMGFELHHEPELVAGFLRT